MTLLAGNLYSYIKIKIILILLSWGRAKKNIKIKTGSVDFSSLTSFIHTAEPADLPHYFSFSCASAFSTLTRDIDIAILSVCLSVRP